MFYLTHSDFYFPYSFKEIFRVLYDKKHFTQDAVDNTIKSIIDSLRRLNVLCVTLQYKHHYKGYLDKEIEEQTSLLLEDKNGGESLTKIQLLKALQCLFYQIETEHLKELRSLTEKETNALFFVRTMINELALDIVNSLPEYDNAKWGL